MGTERDKVAEAHAARRSPPNSDATPAPGSLQDASARGGSRRRPLGAGGSHESRPSSVGPAGEDSTGPGAMIVDGSPQAALEEHLVDVIEAASTSVALDDLHALTQPEHTVIVLRHGICGRQPSQKLADVAEELSLSRVRVRQLQRRAEDALRAETPANLVLAAGG